MSNADNRLILRCQANDAAAFNEIVARYKNRVHSFVSRMVGNGQDAEDLTQETFVRAYLNIGSFQSRASLNTWLFRIATNLCIDFRRKSSRLRKLTDSLSHTDDEDDEDVERDLPDSRFDPQVLLVQSELAAHLDRALAALPEKLRAVVLLHDVEGLAYEEISQVVGCPLGTVKSRLFNARVALRRKLQPYLSGAVVSDVDGGAVGKGRQS